MEDCLRACAAHSGKLVGSREARRVDLAEKLRQLLVAWSLAPAASEPGRPVGAAARLRRAVKGAPSATSALGNELLDALLAVGAKALECGHDDELRLADRISAAVLDERKNSRAGWRLRAQVLEALGAENAALEAYDRYLSLTDTDSFGIAEHAARLRTAAGQQRALLKVLREQTPGAQEDAEGSATDAWARGLALRAAADPDAERHLVGALLAQAAGDTPAEDRDALLDQYLALRLNDAAGAPDAAARLARPAELWAARRRTRLRAPVAEPTFGDVQWLSRGEFRNRIAGRSICLVANSARVGAGSLGAEIDTYDLVVRFTSYRLDPAHTGGRTDIHATDHRHGFNWDQKVTTRLVFGGVSDEWKSALPERVVPGAQRCLGDESLRWPVRNIGGLGADAWGPDPSVGFNMLFLLDFLDVSPTLDLIGFDFHEGAADRLPAATKVPVAPAHERAREKEWVMQRAQSVTDMRISLR